MLFSKVIHRTIDFFSAAVFGDDGRGRGGGFIDGLIIIGSLSEYRFVEKIHRVLLWHHKQA